MRFLCIGLIALTLAACTRPQADHVTRPPMAPNLNPDPEPSPDGRLAIMGGGINFDLNAPPKDWVIVTSDKNMSPNTIFSPLTNVTQDGIPALEIRTGPVQSIALRRVNAMLMATPYLSWAWHLSDHGQGIHPVRIVIGFKGGAPKGTPSKGKNGGLPDHDRALALVWGDSALRRGTLTVPPPERPFEAAIYTVRGGRENTRKWWRDTVDLSELYKRAWPHDERRTIRITFIGIAAAPHMPAIRGRVSGIELTH